MKAGITGHQDLGPPETVQWVSDRLKEAVERYHVDQGVTSLAIGADQLFADILLSKEIPYIVVIPSQGYEQTFRLPEHLENFERLLKHAGETITLDFANPEELAFYLAGKQVVNRSDIVFAVWDGQPAKGLGGTGDLVKYARAKNKKIVHLNPLTKQVR